MEKRAGVVYQLPCSECESSYIGETKRPLETHLREHKAAIKRFIYMRYSRTMDTRSMSSGKQPSLGPPENQMNNLQLPFTYHMFLDLVRI